MADLTNPTPPARPEWAHRVMTALADAQIYGSAEGRLPQSDLDLLDVVYVRLRFRLGESTFATSGEMQDAAEFLLKRATETIAAEEDGHHEL